MKSLTNTPTYVLLVDDETQTLLSFSILLKSSGLTNVITIEDSREVMPFLEESRDSVAVMVLDLSMPFVSGKELLPKARREFPEIPVIVMTAANEIETAVECMKNGAVDYLVKPVEKNRFISSVQRALENRGLKEEVSQLKESLLSVNLMNPDAFAPIRTNSRQMISLFKYIEAIGRSPQPVLITGETGVGKELVARAIHVSKKLKGEFVAVNAAGLDDTMFSDTLFGHKKGSFTGADAVRDGLVARAGRGTLFLDEIGDLNDLSQVKLLRLIQEKEYYPLGSDVPKKTDASVIVATNRNLSQLMESGGFRKDLFFRLSYHHIHVPALRERREDIPLLVRHFLQQAAASMGKKVPAPSPQLYTLLSAYAFPGNIRELESMIYDAVSRHKSGTLSMVAFKKVINTPAEIPASEHDSPLSLNGEQPLEQLFGKFPTLKQMEDYLIDEALKRAGGNQGTAAVFLGVTRQALNKRLGRRGDRK
jgi:two-component system response regulator HydG